MMADPDRSEVAYPERTGRKQRQHQPVPIDESPLVKRTADAALGLRHQAGSGRNNLGGGPDALPLGTARPCSGEEPDLDTPQPAPVVVRCEHPDDAGQPTHALRDCEGCRLIMKLVDIGDDTLGGDTR